MHVFKVHEFTVQRRGVSSQPVIIEDFKDFFFFNFSRSFLSGSITLINIPFSISAIT